MRLLEALLFSIAVVQPPQMPTAMASSGVNPPGTAPTNDQLIAQSANVGRLLYLFDRAAWVSTDALTAKIPKDQLGGVGGYVVELVGEQTVRVTYYRGTAPNALAFFVADVRDGKVVRDDLLATPTALTPQQAAIANARQIAAATALERGYKPCTRAPFNTVVLPSRDNGPIAVYLLTAQLDARSYPMGGNYRVIVSPDSKVLATRPYSVTCLDLKIPKLPAGATPVGLFVNHLLDPVPTEIHVFASYTMRLPLFVGTPDKRVWQVTGSRIIVAALKQ